MKLKNFLKCNHGSRNIWQITNIEAKILCKIQTWSPKYCLIYKHKTTFRQRCVLNLKTCVLNVNTRKHTSPPGLPMVGSQSAPIARMSELKTFNSKYYPIFKHRALNILQNAILSPRPPPRVQSCGGIHQGIIWPLSGVSAILCKTVGV